MGYIVSVIKFDYDDPTILRSSKIIYATQRTMDYYMNQQPYVIEECLIFLLDTPEYVPSLKSATQKSRDSSYNNNNNNNNHNGGGGGEDNTIFNANDYDTHIDQHDIEADFHNIINATSEVEIERNKIWRSINLRNQVYRVITHSMVGMQIKNSNMVFMLDDGIATSDRTYCDVRTNMITDHDFFTNTEYEKECLVATLARHHLTKRVYLYPDDQIVHQNSFQMGEADIKVCHYIIPDRYTYLIVSPDTDLIFILLLHLKTLLDPETGKLDSRYVIILDTRTPKEEKKNISRPYRFIDIIQLYHSIIELFRVEYPYVKNPIETMVLLAYSLKTDFTQPFHPYLRISPAVVWNTFSELHCSKREGFIQFHGQCKNGGAVSDEHDDVDDNDNEKEDEDIEDGEVITSPIIKRKQIRLLPKKYLNLLSDAVTSCYNVDTDAYELDINEISCAEFYYLLCEFRVRDDLALIGYKEYDSKIMNRYILDVDQLFMKVTELEDYIETCKKKGLDGIRKKEEENSRGFLNALESEKKAVAASKKEIEDARKNEKNRKPMISSSNHHHQRVSQKTESVRIEDEAKRNEWLTIFDSIGTISSNTPTATAVANITPIIDKKIVNLANRKNIPPHYAIPYVNQMRARIYRIRWIMNYHQNGWLSTDYSMNFDCVHPENPGKSLHGWTSNEILQTEDNIRNGAFNNSYYTFRYCGGEPVPGKIPFRIYETSETDNVFDRHYRSYFSSH
jgi:hypothetical protein